MTIDRHVTLSTIHFQMVRETYVSRDVDHRRPRVKLMSCEAPDSK